MSWTASKNPEIQLQWRRRVAAHRESGLSLVAFARQHDFSPSSLGIWRRWFEQHPDKPPALVEIQVEATVPAPTCSMVLELPGRCMVHLQPGFDAPTLLRLVTTLEQL